MNAYERLLLEAIPVRPAPADPYAMWTPDQQAQHQADLLEALTGWEYHRDARHHLHLVDEPTAA